MFLSLRQRFALTPQLRFAAQPSVSTGPPHRGRRGVSAPAGAAGRCGHRPLRTDARGAFVKRREGQSPSPVFFYLFYLVRVATQAEYLARFASRRAAVSKKTGHPSGWSVWQGQKGSNSRHAVLETAALPTELYPYVVGLRGLEPGTGRL